MKVNFFAPMNHLGYGIHSYNTIRAFEKRGHTATVIPPFGQVHRTDELIARWTGRRHHFDPNAPGVMIFHEEYLTQFCGRPRIGFPVFECEKFTPLQLAGMRSCDALLTPTQWGKDVLVRAGISGTKIWIVNEGFDPEVFKDVPVSESEEKSEPFTFVHVGKFEERKGTLQMIRCFFTALENEQARLFLHVANPFVTNYDAMDVLLEKLGFISTNAGKTFRRMGLSIHFTNPYESPAEVAALYRKADCGLYPTRAEGWGLPILETLATGAPCVVGNWTGQSEYVGRLPKSYPFFIERYTTHKIQDDIFFAHDHGEWRVPEDEGLVEKIRLAFHSAREFRKIPIWGEAVRFLRSFTWDEAADQLESALKGICGL